MLFGLLHRRDINQGVKEWRETHGAVLLDVRTKVEYADGHIEGSVNIPLDELETIGRVVPDKGTPIFVHCLSGARSASAAASGVNSLDGGTGQARSETARKQSCRALNSSHMPKG